ncbi:DNA polymerase III subunit delta [Candidatus Binatia bacterium]|nr:DNA polymerase III subunit delta [Candidatus Binatia bacterium]
MRGGDARAGGARESGAASGGPAAATGSVLLLTGDGLLVDRRLAEIQAGSVGANPAFGAFELLQGDQATLEDVMTAVRTFSPTGSRLVVLRRAERLREEAQKALAAVLDEIPAGARLVLVALEPDMRKSLFAALAKRGAVEQLELGHARDAAGTRRAVIALAGKMARELKLRLGAGAVEALVDHVGNEPQLLAREIEKLALRFPDVEIGPEQVLDTVSGERSPVAFALEGAVRDRRVAHAVAALRRALGQGDRPELLVGQIASELRALLRARALLDSGMDEESVKRTLGGRGFYVVPRARNYRRAELERALRALGEVDVAAKTGGGAVPARLEKVLLDLRPPRATS